MEINDKVAIVTGASGGIGAATAKLLGENGAKVALVARSEEKLAKISSKIPDSMFIVCDMSNPVEIKAMVKSVKEHFGRIDILVNNAGQGYDASIEETDIENYHKIFDLNVIGPLTAMQNVIPVMKDEKGGTIINVSSGTALMALPNMAAYSSTKRALAQISMTASMELKDKNIKVSVIYPYVTLSDFEKNTIKSKPEEVDTDWINHLPHPPDSSEFVAKVIMNAIMSGEVEVFAHDWLKK